MSGKQKPPILITARTSPRAAMFAGARGEAARLKRQIRDNERIWAGFRRLEIRLIGVHSLRDFVAVLAHDMPRIFSSVDCVTFACFDPEYELTRLLQTEEAEAEQEGRVGGADML